MLWAQLAIVVACAACAAVMLLGLVIACGSLAVRRLRLPADPPEELAFEPPAPAPVPAGDRAEARARAAAWQARAEVGRRALAVQRSARSAADEAAWIGACQPDRAQAARATAAVAASAAERARAAWQGGDEAGLAAAELEASTAAARLANLSAGLPDWRAAERRKLLILSAALVVALALAAVSLWPR